MEGLDSMKKFYIAGMVGVAALSLAACNDSATPVEGTTEKSDLALEEVFNKTMERQESLKSVKAAVTMDQSSNMLIDGEEITMTTTSNIDMSLTMDPMALFVDGIMSMKALDEQDAFEMPLQMYLTEADGFYMNDMMSDGWIKLPDEMYDDLLAQAGASADSTEQLKQLKPFINDFTFKQTDSAYILTLSANGEKFKSLIMEQVSGTLGQQLESEELLTLEDMQFDDAKYVLTIDKKTFDMTKTVMDFDFIMEIEGITATIKTSSTINYSDFNKIEAIKIPQNILDTAVDSDF